MSEPTEAPVPARPRFPIGKTLWELGFGLVSLVLVAPVFTARHLPLQDLPQHMAAISVLRRLLFTSSLDAYFTATLSRTQYLLVYGLGIPLSAIAGVEGAAKVLTAITLVATPYALRYTLKKMGRDERLAALAWPLVWNPQLLLGFLNFLLGVPIALVALGMQVAPTRSRRQEVVLAVLALGAFYAHLVPYGLVGLGTLLLLEWGPLPRSTEALRETALRVWRQGRFLVPSLVAAVVWVLRTPAGDESVRAGGVGVRPHPQWPEMASLARDLSGALVDAPGDFDERTLLGWGIAVLGAIALTTRAATTSPATTTPRPLRWPALLPVVAVAVYLVRHRAFSWIWGANTPPEETWGEIGWHALAVAAIGALAASAMTNEATDDSPKPSLAAARLAWLPVACAALYLMTPSSYGWIWPIHTRFAVTAGLLVPLLVSGARGMKSITLLGLLAATVSMGFSLDLSTRFTRWNDQELGDLDATLAHAEPGRRLLGLTPPIGSGLVPNVPILHAAAYYQVRGGAVATFSFADFPQSPFRYREDGPRPPRLPPRWEWEASLDIADPSRTYYDYVLCRRGASEAPARDASHYRLVHEGRYWSLYARTGGR